MTKARVNADNASADIQGVTAGTGLTGGGTSGTVTVTNSMATAIDAKGDLVAGTGADAFARIAVGANGTVLKANSATATGLEWGAAGAAGDNFTLLGTGVTTSGTTVTVSGISGMNSIKVMFQGISGSMNNPSFSLLINGDTAANYNQALFYYLYNASYSAGLFNSFNQVSGSVTLTTLGINTSALNGFMEIDGCNSTGVKPYQVQVASDSTQDGRAYWVGGVWQNTATITSIGVRINGGASFDSGSFLVYGSA